MPGEATYSKEQVDQLVAAAVAAAKTEVKAQFEAALGEAKVALTDAGTKLAAAEAAKEVAEAALVAFKDEQTDKDIVEAVDGAIKDGKALPTEKDTLVAMGRSMRGTIKLASGEKSGFEVFKDSLVARPQVVKFTEALHGKRDGEGDKNAGVEVDRLAREKITAAGGETKLAYKDAVAAVLTQDPALKQRYLLEV